MTHIQLSDAQSVILSTACAREDGKVFPVTASLKGGAVGNVCKSLLKRKLIEEVPATDQNTVWRHDEERGPVTLRATPLGYAALGITDAPQQHPDDQPEPTRRRVGTKQEALIAMLCAEGGATINEIVAALEWRPHTVRGVISGTLKKRLGHSISTLKIKGKGRVYKLEAELSSVSMSQGHQNT